MAGSAHQGVAFGIDETAVVDAAPVDRGSLEMQTYKTFFRYRDRHLRGS